jgi:hypothetical protein
LFQSLFSAACAAGYSKSHSKSHSESSTVKVSRMVELGLEGKEMISLRLAVPAVLVAAAVAACFTYFVTPPSPVEADQRLPPTARDMARSNTGTPTNIDQRPSAEKQAAAAFQRAATAILRQAPYAQASAGTNELPLTGHIPLPKRRPIPRP